MRHRASATGTPGRPARSGSSAFTLIESLVSIVVLMLMATAITSVYISGLRTIEVGGERALLDSAHRSAMEEMLSKNFADIADASDSVVVLGNTYSITWTVVTIDLNGDGTPEPDAKRVTVTLDGRSLEAIVVDHQGRVKKI